MEKQTIISKEFEQWFGDIFTKLINNNQCVKDMLEIATNDVAGAAEKIQIVNTAISFDENKCEAEHKIAYWDGEDKLYNLTIWLTIRKNGLISYRFQYKGSDKSYYAGNKALFEIFFYLNKI